jgi:hypothetical protein
VARKLLSWRGVSVHEARVHHHHRRVLELRETIPNRAVEKAPAVSRTACTTEQAATSNREEAPKPAVRSAVAARADQFGVAEAQRRMQLDRKLSDAKESGSSSSSRSGSLAPTPPNQPYTRADKQADRFPDSIPDETLAQYAMRTAKATGFDTNQLGALLFSASGLGAAPNAPYKEIIDRYQNPTAYWSDAELARQNAMRERDIQEASRVYTGPVPVTSLTDQDKLYLYSMALQPGNNNLHYDVLRGRRVDIANAINWASYNFAGYDPSTYDGPLRPIVEQVIAQRNAAHGGG